MTSLAGMKNHAGSGLGTPKRELTHFIHPIGGPSLHTTDNFTQLHPLVRIHVNGSDDILMPFEIRGHRLERAPSHRAA